MEHGYNAVTIDAIASRAGVSKPTVYRRWSGRQAVMVAAMERFVQPREVPDLGSFRAEVLAFLRDRAEIYKSAGVRRIMAGSVAASNEDADFHRDVQPFIDRFPAGMRRIIQRGIARGEVRPDIDIDLLTAMINGGFYYRSIIEQKGLDEQAVAFVTDVVLAGVTPIR